MKNIALITIFIVLYIPLSLAQSLTGKYNTQNDSHKNGKHFEELDLRSDSTFSYSTRMEFIKISKEGRWSIFRDTIVLNENNPCCSEKIVVQEKCNKKLQKGIIRFYVSSLEGEEIDYHLVVVNKDSTRTIWSMTGLTEIKLKGLRQFYFIINSLIYSPVYKVKSVKSNEFRIRLANSRFFLNEKWLFRNGVIIPIGWDNKYAGYSLTKESQ